MNTNLEQYFSDSWGLVSIRSEEKKSLLFKLNLLMCNDLRNLAREDLCELWGDNAEL
jgi:hypothetical protein